jgi:hypothetical protein
LSRPLRSTEWAVRCGADSRRRVADAVCNRVSCTIQSPPRALETASDSVASCPTTLFGAIKHVIGSLGDRAGRIVESVASVIDTIACSLTRAPTTLFSAVERAFGPIPDGLVQGRTAVRRIRRTVWR